MSAASFGTVAQVMRYSESHGLTVRDDPEDIRRVRELIALERGRCGLPPCSPSVSAHVSPSVLLVHSDEEITALPFGPRDWAILHRPARLVKRTS